MKKQQCWLRQNPKNKQSRLIMTAFTALASVIGAGVLIAAVPAARFEAESGVLSSNACLTADVNASGGSYVAFLASSCAGEGLPAGVTLQDIDGGQAYFEQWSNTTPSAGEDPSFFPIIIYQSYDLNAPVYTGMSRIASHKAIGINGYAHLANGILAGSPSDMQIVKNNGMYVYAAGPSPDVMTQTVSNTFGSNLAGYGYQDEIDGASSCSMLADYPAFYDGNCIIGDFTKIHPTNLLNFNENLRAADNTRPIYQGYTNAYAIGWFPGGPPSILAQAADIIGYDMYPLIERRGDYGGYITNHVWDAYNTVMEARANASYAKPVWPDVETSPTDWDGGMNEPRYRPSSEEVQALVWNYIIGGARGIAYFNHCFCSGSPMAGHDDLNNSALSDIRAGVANVNARIKNLAPVLNSHFANGYETHNGQINTMVKYHNGTFYIFAAPKASGSQTVTFTPKTGSSVTVVDENRTINFSGGTFTDTFANETTVHIYKVNP